jgi:hypothetical protein
VPRQTGHSRRSPRRLADLQIGEVESCFGAGAGGEPPTSQTTGEDVFRVQPGAVEDLILSAAARRYKTRLPSLREDDAASLGPVGLSDLVGPGVRAQSHFGNFSSQAWQLVYALFVTPRVVQHPPDFAAKSVLFVDVYSPPAPWGRVGYLSVWAEGIDGEHGVPVLAPFPEVPDVLLGERDGSLLDAATAFTSLVDELVRRVNLVVPAARDLAGRVDHK